MDQEQAVGKSPVKKNPSGKVRKFLSMNVKMNDFFYLICWFYQVRLG